MAKYIATGYKQNGQGKLLPSVRGTAGTKRDGHKLATQIRELAVPGTCFGYPLVTLAIEGGETVAEWRLGDDLQHHSVPPDSTPDRLAS